MYGCQEDTSVVTYSPEPKNVEGLWESMSLYQYFPYAALSMKRDGSGKVVLVTSEENTVEAILSDFVTHKESFFVTLRGTEEGDEAEQWEGSLKRGQLCFRMLDFESKEQLEEGEFPLACFTKVRDAKRYREIALEVLSQ